MQCETCRIKETYELATLSKNAQAYIGFTFIEPFDQALQRALDAVIAVELALELMPD